MVKRRIKITENLYRPEFESEVSEVPLYQIECLETFTNLATGLTIEKGDLGGYMPLDVFERLDQKGSWWFGPGVKFMYSDYQMCENTPPIADHVFVDGPVIIRKSMLKKRVSVFGLEDTRINNCIIDDDVKITGDITLEHSIVSDSAIISHTAEIYNCKIIDQAKILGKTVIKNMIVESNAVVKNCILKGTGEKEKTVITRGSYVESVQQTLVSAGPFVYVFKKV